MASIATLQSFHKDPDLRIWLLGATVLPPVLFLLLHEQFSVLALLLVLFTLVLAWNISRTVALGFLFLFLFVLGDVRRIVSLLGGTPALDPLLLTGALFGIYLVLPVLLHLRLTDSFSKAVLALMVLMTLEIVNPRQGPVFVGISGALFYVVPMFWFWIARRYATPRMMSSILYRVVVPVGTAAALLGIYQTYVGFLPWQEAWIKAVSVTYSALNLGGGHIRSFGFSVNSVEYGSLLTLSATVVVAAVLNGRRVFALLLPVLLPAMVLSSMRGALIKSFLAVAVMWAVGGRGRHSLKRRLALVVLLAVGGVLFSMHDGGDGGGAAPLPGKSSSSAQAATSHVTQGRSHPFHNRYSTAGLHWQMVVDGVTNGFRYPLGSGLGAVTLGASKFGGDPGVTGSSELDVSDAFITMGFVGGLLYIFVLCITLRRAYLYVRSGDRDLALPLLGILVAMLGAWIALGQYAVAPLVWFCIGFLTSRGEISRTSSLPRPQHRAVVTAAAARIG